MEMLLIGFGHRARQGKNAAAIAMLNAAPVESRARIYAYADALRAEVARAVNAAGGLEAFIKRGYVCEMGADPVVLPLWVKAESGKPRTLLQWWGTDYRRAQDPDYWVKRFRERLDRDQPDLAFVTDVRFPNELEAIHAAGGYVVKVVRSIKPDIAVPAHPSENALDGYTGWDYTLTAATLPELRTKAAALYPKIAGKQ